ncbi:MAG: ribbon-helix-helix protein, CopG family [Terriglobales bacterium]
MKEKTSITLSAEVLAGVDRLAGSGQSRSAFIELVLRRFLHEQERVKLHARDLQLLNAAADELNAEAEGVLGYQASQE